MSKEIWRDIKDYEGLYQVSNLGRVKSLERIVNKPRGQQRVVEEKIMTPIVERKGYTKIQLQKQRKKKTVRIHLLVWDAFGDKPRDGHRLQVDHIDHNKLNNNIGNLQLLTNKENIRKYFGTKERTSEYPNVYRNARGLFIAQTKVNGKTIYLGSYNIELEAYKRTLQYD